MVISHSYFFQKSSLQTIWLVYLLVVCSIYWNIHIYFGSSDLLIKIHDKEICGHRFVLAARSDSWGVEDLSQTTVLDLSGFLFKLFWKCQLSFCYYNNNNYNYYKHHCDWLSLVCQAYLKLSLRAPPCCTVGRFISWHVSVAGSHGPQSQLSADIDRES